MAASTMLAAACASSSIESAIDAPMPDFIGPCTDQYADGELIDYTDGDFSNACRDDAGGLVVPVPVQLDCTDGPELVYNEFAWGYVGDEMTLFPSDDEERRPDQELILDCLQRGEDDGDTGVSNGTGTEADTDPPADTDAGATDATTE